MTYQIALGLIEDISRISTQDQVAHSLICLELHAQTIELQSHFLKLACVFTS